MLTRIKKITPRKNDLMMIADIEDLTGKIGLVIFPRAYEKYVSFLNEDIPILVKGKIDSNMDEHKLICEEIEPLEKKNTKRSLHVEIASKDKANLEYMKRIKDTLLMFPGQESAFIHIGDKIICVGGQYGVTINPALVENIERLAGEGSARIDFEEVEA
jgi:DNA polymerase-3 subunit alpha